MILSKECVCLSLLIVVRSYKVLKYKKGNTEMTFVYLLFIRAKGEIKYFRENIPNVDFSFGTKRCRHKATEHLQSATSTWGMVQTVLQLKSFKLI